MVQNSKNKIFKDFLQEHNINQIKLSEDQSQFTEKITNQFQMKKYESEQATTLFMGLKSQTRDIMKIINHKGLAFILADIEHIQLLKFFIERVIRQTNFAILPEKNNSTEDIHYQIKPEQLVIVLATKTIQEKFRIFKDKNSIIRQNIRTVDLDIEDFSINSFLSFPIDNKLIDKLVDKLVDKKFIFVIPSYNNENYYKKNLDSVINQTYKNWHIIYIDDASTDNTNRLVGEYIKQNNISDKITMMTNEKNMKQAYSRFQAYKKINKEDIICFLDGDDWLYDNNILHKLNIEYKSDIVLTFGSYYKYENNKLINILRCSSLYNDKNNDHNYKKTKRWDGIPLRTGYAYLYKSIPEEYYKDANNEWMSACTDVAEFLWAIEQSSGKFKNIKYPTYVYNIDASKRFDNSIYNLNDEQKKYRIATRDKIYSYKNPLLQQQSFSDFLKAYNIKSVKTSSALEHFHNRIKKQYNLSDYNLSDNNPALFYGLYFPQDLQNYLNHKGEKIIVAGGSDFNFISKNIKSKNIDINNTIFIAISEDLYNRFKILKTEINKCINIFYKSDFSLVDKSIFYPRNELFANQSGKKIYIYDGYSKNQTAHNSVTYGKKNYDEVIKQLSLKPEDIIFSSSLGGIPNEKMPEIYEQCYIGLRLTEHDGNANTVQEFEAMNIPIVHNQSKYGLKWKTTDDIISHIKRYNEKEFQYNFYKDEITNDMLPKIWKNIDNFTNKIISNYNNVLFVCGDYPGYGGAATNCSHIANFIKTKQSSHSNKSVFSIYFNYNMETTKSYEKTDDYIVVDKKDLLNELNKIKKEKFIPDAVILKSAVNLNFKQIFNKNINVIYLIPGIYLNTLNKPYTELKTKSEQEKYINPSVIRQIQASTNSFCNSSHTQKILKKYYNLDTDLFYSTFVPFYGEKIKQESDKQFRERKYTYGLITSNFSRSIKNVKQSIEFLKDKKNVVLIGQEASKYKKEGFTCIELVERLEMTNYYKQIKYIIQDSYYESCSNVKVESIFNGCKKIPAIVVSSTQYPGYGGAATNAYQIIKYLRNNGYNTVGVFFHNNLDVNYDPEEIGGIFLYSCKFNKNKVRNDAFLYLKTNPTFCLAKNYRAPTFCKNIFNCYTVYLVSGINHFILYPTTSALELLDKSFTVNKVISEEIIANKISDSIIVNSDLTYDIFCKIYPQFVYKLKSPLDTTFCINHLNKSFTKEYDIILVCSNFKRKSKNNIFLLDVLNNKKNDKYKKLVIGENSNLFKNIKNVTILPLQIQEKCLEYMAKSKLLLHPALFESNSNTIREAYYHKCLPMITRNVGYNELFPGYLICNDFTTDEWVNKVKYVLDNYDNVKNTVINFNTTLDISNLLTS